MFDYCVIGGGVVGTAIFNKLTRLGRKVALVEIQNDVGFGASRANTALIHSGIDCKPNTLKAKLNLRGNELYPALAERLNVKLIQNGHLIVGNDQEKLDNLIQRAKENGVRGVKLLMKNQLHKLEPNLSETIEKGLYIPSGGMVSSYYMSVALAEEAIVNGGEVFLEFNTKKINTTNNGFTLEAKDKRVVECTKLINACGAGFNDINKLLKAENYDLQFRRGEYYLLDRSTEGYVSHPIFPLPTEVSKGILVSPTVHGNIMVGPTSTLSDTIAITTSEDLNKIKQEVGTTFKNVPFKENIRVFSGIRTISGDDFIIEKSKIVKNLINVAGICSPGLTSAPAIAEMVAELLGEDPKNEVEGLKPRPSQIHLNDLSVEEQNKIIKGNPDFGKVVCRCENISLGEIKQCFNSPLPVNSVDAVKRRTRAGMGRCQGGFCIFSVMEEISKANDIKFDKVLKDGVGSTIIKSKIKPSKRG